jgi:hypothetical protein
VVIQNRSLRTARGANAESPDRRPRSLPSSEKITRVTSNPFSEASGSDSLSAGRGGYKTCER